MRIIDPFYRLRAFGIASREYPGVPTASSHCARGAWSKAFAPRRDDSCSPPLDRTLHRHPS
jgi:hypothetical protein